MRKASVALFHPGRQYPWRILVYSLFLLLAACGRNLQRADLVFINGAEPESLDPALITGQPEGRVVNALFEGLTTFDASGKVVPGVAERWEISPDKKTYTFFLRENAKWSNGTPVVASDFVNSWKRVLTPATASDYAGQLLYLKNAKAFHEGEISDFSKVGVRALNDRTLEVTLENPTSFFLDLCAFVTLAPVPIKTIEKEGDNWIKPGKIVSNGAYQLQEWRINDRIRLVKNPHYWNRDTVKMTSIDILPIANANTAFNFYYTGQADLTMDKGLVPTQFLNELKKRPDFHASPFLGVYFLRFNCTRPPFDNPLVRRAFSLVLDKPLLVDKITQAGELPAESLVPPGTAGYEPPKGTGMNTELARKLLAEAGYPGGKNFPPIAYLYSAGQQNEAIAIEIQGMLSRELGIKMDLQRQEWKVYLNSMSTLNFDLCRGSWIGDYNDPNTFLGLFITGEGNNRTGWGNPTYDALIAEAAGEGDPVKRFALFRQAEELLINKEAPIAPLFFYVGIQLYDGNRLGGIEANLLDEHPLKAMYWKR